MFRVILLSILLITTFYGSTKTIDKKIKNNKKSLKNTSVIKKHTATKIKLLADSIAKNEEEYEKLEHEEETLINTIFLNKLKLQKVKSDVIELKKNTIKIKQQTKSIQENIVDEVIDKYSASLAIPLAKKSDQQEVIDKEVYTLLLEQSKDNILQLNLNYLELITTTRNNENKMIQLAQYIKEQEGKKIKLKQLKKTKAKTIKLLSQQHKKYQKQLQKIIDQQNHIQDILSNLHILKIQTIKKEKRAKEQKQKEQQRKSRLAKLKEQLKIKAKQKAKKKKRSRPLQNKEIKISKDRKILDKAINIKVKNIGSSTRGIKIAKYKGRKTIAPLKSYTIVKKFGKYYDPVYKIELFNEALTMKPKRPNSKVYNILSGKIVYVKQNQGILSNVVIVQHSNNLSTIYSNLDRIAPTLRVGKWIKKGFVVGRVSDTLMFQATKNGKFINPKELIK